MDIELRHLRALIAVAEELNFTRAAERLHLTQQALSGQIRQLEQRVGAQLVERDTHHVALTAAGMALYERCRPLLADTESAVAAARAADSGATPALVIGYPAPLVHRLAAPAIQLFARRHPEVEITINFGGLLDPSGGLREQQADVAFVYGAFESQGLELRHLFSEPLGAALAADHPLARKSSVTLDDLLQEPFIEVASMDAVNREFWLAGKHRSEPARIGATVQSLDGLMETIGAGLGVALAVAAVVDALGVSAGVVFRPVPGLEPLDFWVARRAGDAREWVSDFMDAAADAAPPRLAPTARL